MNERPRTQTDHARIAAEEDFALKAWNRLWTHPDTQQKWSEPSPEVRSVLSSTGIRQGARALDVGCGAGRHFPLFAEFGITAYGIDASIAAVETCRSRLEATSMKGSVLVALLDQVPFSDDSFDFVLCFNVIYHQSRQRMKRSISELKRCCRHDGYIFVTFLSTMHSGCGHGARIEPFTFVREEESGEKRVLHHFSDEADVREMIGSGRICEIVESEPIVMGCPDTDRHQWFVLFQP
jgi:2-polyprenyl-3-methyl-5-hydroxy-6-metoxy-1,4-benzoquinol methylase